MTSDDGNAATRSISRNAASSVRADLLPDRIDDIAHGVPGHDRAQHGLKNHNLGGTPGGKGFTTSSSRGHVRAPFEPEHARREET